MTTTRRSRKRSSITATEASSAKSLVSGTRKKTKETPTNDSSEPWFSVFTKGDAEYNAYMSTEWGFEKRGDVPLFEKLSLEGAQSGLSWLTILRKRQAYRDVFHGFDPVRVASMSEVDVERILNMDGESRDTVVRHRGKIEAIINNAKCILKMRSEAGNHSDSDKVFDRFLWSFVDDKPILNRGTFRDLPTKTRESEAMSKALKTQGFKFVGPTTCYALMQSVGMVIDHPVGSPEWQAAYERLKERPGGYQEAGKAD